MSGIIGRWHFLLDLYHPIIKSYARALSWLRLRNARDYEVPELSQVVLLAMLLNDAVKLDVLRRWMIAVMESTLKELQWTTFQA